MAGIAQRYELRGLGEAQAKLNELLAAEADMTPMFDRIGAGLVDNVLARFESGVGPDGVPWLPSQRALDQGGQTLVDTGRLRDSFTWVAGPTSVEVGTNLIYAGIHQFGGLAGRGHAVELPARPMLPTDELAPEDRSVIEDEVVVFWTETIQ